MSGPQGTSEIEDFVSSVRRLVSADARSRPTTRELAQDRLVLTPALRVVPEAAEAAAPLILTAPATDEVATQPEPLSGPDTVVEAAAVAAVQPDDQQSEAVLADAPQTYDAEWEEEIWSEPGQPLSELALGAEEAEVIADSTPEAAVATAPSAADTVKRDSPWAEVGEGWLDDDLSEAPQAKAQPPKPGKAEAMAERQDVLRLTAEDMLTDSEGNPLTVLDEAALQQIMRQLIREELKGVLGERITQSVRKLVRAEINRALAAHALD